MGLKGKEVLIIDDDPQIREFYSTVLESAGMRTSSSEGRESAKDHLKSQTPHLILLDIGLSKGNNEGVELLKHIKSMPSLLNTPVIIISSKANKEIIYMTLALGATDYQLKPVSTRQLLQRVRKVFLDYKSPDLSFINEFTGEFDASFIEIFEGDFEVEIEIPAQIMSINELSCILNSSVKFSKEQTVKVKSPLGTELGQEKLLLRANENGRSIKQATFSTRCSLVAVNEKTAQKLRTMRGGDSGA